MALPSRRARPATALLLAPLLLAACVGLPPLPAGERLDAPLRHLGRLEAPGLVELSGMVRVGDLLWTHGDSGAAALHAFDLDLVQHTPDGGRPVPGATLVDWEDIAVLPDADGDVLWVADLGNNRSARRDLALWRVHGKDGQGGDDVRRRPFAWPDQRAFPDPGQDRDSEALFAADGALWILTKHRDPDAPERFVAGTRLYRLDPDDEGPPVRVDARDDVGPVTAADLSPDGRTLAVLTYRAVWLFDRPADGRRWLSGPARLRPLPLLRTRQVEALAWIDDERLWIANESGEVHELSFDREASVHWTAPGPALRLSTVPDPEAGP